MTMSLKTKQEICQRKHDVPSLTIDQLAAEYSCDRTKFIDLENAMAIWTKRVLSQNGILTDGLLQIQAKKFAELLNISEDDFKASQGWRESKSVPIEDLADQRRKLAELLLQYKPEDVYNADETGLYYRMMPNQTLASKPVKGQKKVKDRVT
ncbi:13361_t:CDS:2, partial [Gigaspora rosea]